MTETNQQFEHFATWVNMASSWLTRRGPHVHAVCIDARGRACEMGKDFMRARDEDAFPVRWLWPEDVAALAAGPAQLFRHRKRGSVYTLVGTAKLQTETPLSDMAEVMVYRHAETGELWARPPSEFWDGRFEEVDPAIAKATTP